MPNVPIQNVCFHFYSAFTHILFEYIFIDRFLCVDLVVTNYLNNKF